MTSIREATMADVAKLAGVSLGTVSHVLSNRTPVREETRERVETAMAQLGYRPNRVAQALRRQRTHVVGMIVPDVANPFFAELLLGVESRLEPAGYAVVFGNSRESGSVQQRYVDRFLERQVDGLIVAIAGDTDPFDLQNIAKRTHIILVDRTVPGWSGDQVVGDDERGMGLAVQHLRQTGHSKLALINGDRALSTARRRLEGFEGALRRLGLKPFYVSHGSFSMESGQAQTAALLDLRDRPTALCAGNDLLALAAYAELSIRGLRVPDDLSIVGYDDITYARMVSPPLTTVRQQAAEMGAAAANLLLERLGSGRSLGRSITVRPELVVRQSTASTFEQ